MTPGGKASFLIRSVYLNSETGGFRVRASAGTGDAVIVDHGSLGRHPVPMKRQALVVPLARKPDNVFVSYKMAE